MGRLFSNPILRRLLPLYMALFCQGFILFYAIEKLFMRQIGFDDAGIGVMVAAYSAIMLLVETPSGILADRWSRKGVLVLASIFLAASALVGGLSNGVGVYLVAAGLWGVFFALYTGTYDSMLYDTLLEEKQAGRAYERWYGYMKVVDGSALVLGSLLGGVVAAQFGLREAYFLTIPIALLSIGALLAFREPVLHKQHEIVPISQQVRDTFGAVLRRGRLLYIVAILVAVTLVTSCLYEFSQLWWIALAMPVVAFGPANALLTSVVGFGGLAASYLRMHRYVVIQASLLIILLSAAVLVISRSSVPIVAAQVVLGTGVVALGVVFNRLLHDELPSSVRAGASSAVSTLTRLLLIPVALIFGFISREIDAFHAGWLFVAFLLPCFVLAARLHADRKTLPIVTPANEPIAEEYQK